ncbi:centrosomal protein of 41 kDa isoform X2 [Thalassophryne amazonica]|uniref:centrosomal protein of 41 kDa isoform X2 n=1 Tax=Thalassophryne amazonica TaxID=390379 RepID=UPI0014717A9E|nr:centrosomal protein of 41 kDa isoform X2 [Thalassophryne amazonica]
MSFSGCMGDVKYINKKVPKSAKYQHVKSKLDTGSSLTKYMERLEEIHKYGYRKGEIFRQLKVTTFAKMVLQVASISDLHAVLDYGESHDAGGTDSQSVMQDAGMDSLCEQTHISLQTSPIPDGHELGEPCDIVHTSTATLPSPEHFDSPYPECPYLLLDVRDCDQYDQCHIIGAHSFPVAMLNRTMNPYTKELLEYKNAAGKIIIVYDEDEKIANRAATILCERTFDNVFLLSGGLSEIAQKFPGSMTTGTIPSSCLPTPPSSGSKKRTAPLQTSVAAEKRWRFTSDELAKIQQQLEMLIPTNTSGRMSSRMSTISTQSKVSSARIRQTNPSARSDMTGTQSRRPWK